MLTLRQRIFIISGIIIGVILAVVLFILYARAPKAPDADVIEEQADQNQANVNTQQTQIPRVIVPAPTSTVPQTPEEVYMKQLAKMFVERFLSYSNQSGDQHLEDVLTFVTPKMKAWVLNQAVEQKQVYEGMTTSVLSTHVLEKTGDKAKIEIGAQQIVTREKENGGIETLTEQKTGSVDLVKVGGEWKVDGVWWDE
ncbi:MAG: hypothetical protein WCW16_04180 [Candidatus Magasanikbacteria bacterium]